MKRIKQKKRVKIQTAFAGGGMLFLQHLGAVIALRSDDGLRKYEVTETAGTSAGALASAFLNSDLSTGDMIDAVLSFFPVSKKLLDPSFLPTRYGFIRGDKLTKELSKYVPEKFSDCKIPCSVFTSNIDRQCVSKWSTVCTPNESLPDRVIDSCRIPGIFKARKINGNNHTDGGVAYNFPIDNFDQVYSENSKIVGFMFQQTIGDELPPRKSKIHFVYNYMRHAAGHITLMQNQTIIESIDDVEKLDRLEIIKFRIPISLKSKKIGSLSFDMSKDDALKMIESGMEHTCSVLGIGG